MRSRLKGITHAVLGGLFTLALLVASVAPSWAQPDNSFAYTKQIKWRTSTATICTGCPVDSSEKMLNGATAMVDTTQAIDTFDFDGWASGAVNTTAFMVAAPFVRSLSGAVANVDTLFWACDLSPNGSDWYQSSAFAGAVLATANDAWVRWGLPVDADAVNSPWLARFIRFRIRADGNTSATYPNAQFWISYRKLSSTKGQ